MNIGFNACAVCPNGSAFFDIFFFGITQDVAIDHLSCLLADGLDIAIQSRLFKAFFGNADAAEPTQALRVYDMKGKLFVSKCKKSFGDGTAQHLIGTHALGSGTMAQGFVLVQILQYMPTDGRVGIDDVADDFQLFALRMIENVRHQRHLFLIFFAHFEVVFSHWM